MATLSRRPSCCCCPVSNVISRPDASRRPASGATPCMIRAGTAVRRTRLVSARTSLAATMVRNAGSLMPTSFNDDGRLFAFNLFLMTAFTCLASMMAARLVRSLWRDRNIDEVRDPVTIWRMAWCCASTAAFLRCGIEAMNLWAWSPTDPVTTARVIMAKRWIDPLALLFASGWMLLVLLSSTGMEQQLRKRPYPIDIWARLPALRPPVSRCCSARAGSCSIARSRSTRCSAAPGSGRSVPASLPSR